MKTKDEQIDLIAGRIIDEYRKHPLLEWNKIAAAKIHSQWFDYLNQQTKELQEQLAVLNQAEKEYIEKIVKLEEQLEEKTEALENSENGMLNLIKYKNELVEQLAAKEKECLDVLDIALKYFNGFDSPEQNEAAFHALNNLRNKITNT